jgi:PrtD family type I secretion system ABC transporter
MQPLFQLLRGPLATVVALSFFVNLLLLAPALFMLQLFDRVLTSQSQDTLLVLLLGMALAMGLMLVLDYLRSRMQGVAGNVVADHLSPIVARLMLGRAAHGGQGASSEALRDVQAIRQLFSAQGLLALFDAPWAPVYVAVIWLAHPLLGMAAAGACLLMLALAAINDRITRRGIEALQTEAARATRYLESSMQNADVVQSLGMGESLLARWRQLNGGVTALQGPIARKSVAMAAFTRMTRQSVQVMIQALGAYLVITGEGTAGILVATTILLARALGPVEQVVGSWHLLAEGGLAFKRLRAMVNEVQCEPARMPLPTPAGRLEAQAVVYRVPQSGKVLLAGVSLSLEPGESLAIIGASGAGKSTLLRLLTGLWQPSAGVVRLDHSDIALWPREALGPWLGYVPQDVELFPGTIGQNIARLGDADPELVIRAAQRAGVHELILGLPEGYDTPIDPRGTLLSPGQRQRIALARALYGDPKLLVLDEPNSNLDGAGELALGEALRALHGRVTVVVVTHRSALVQHVDKIMVLEAGRVQQYGTQVEIKQAAMKRAGGGAQVVPLPRAAGAGAHASYHQVQAPADSSAS